MTKEELAAIVKLANRSAIESELEKLGYIHCNKHEKLGKVGVVELVQSVTAETADFTDNEHKHLYNGRICGTVKGYEDYEFVYINVYDIKPSKDPFDDEKRQSKRACLFGRRSCK